MQSGCVMKLSCSSTSVHVWRYRADRKMTFELVRCGWPNSVAIAALALLPLAALVMDTGQQQRGVRPIAVEAAGYCPGGHQPHRRVDDVRHGDGDRNTDRYSVSSGRSDACSRNSGRDDLDAAVEVQSQHAAVGDAADALSSRRSSATSYSRARIAGWLSQPPTSLTKPPAREKYGSHAGLIIAATMMSPSRKPVHRTAALGILLRNHARTPLDHPCFPRPGCREWRPVRRAVASDIAG